MATYAIGDIHGCWFALQRLLRLLPMDEARDRLWLVGDLVNRGPDSLAVLRWARRRQEVMGERFVAVLGNHDLHTVRRAAGLAKRRKKDTLEELLAAPDGDELLTWLAARPLLHRNGDMLLVHAGLWPEWTAAVAEEEARRAEEWLRRPQRLHRLSRQGEGQAEAAGILRSLEAFTKLRASAPDGRPCSFTGPPPDLPEGCLPWYQLPERRSKEVTIVCGHWAAAGLILWPNLVALDTGCVWGGELTAVRLDDRKVYRVAAAP